MIKKLCAASFLLLITLKVFSQGGSISGVIIDKNNGEAIVGATILLGESLKGTSTDIDGNYTLKNVPAGKHDLKISFISYESITVKDINVENGKTTTVNASMLESSTELNEVVVTNVRRMNSDVSMISAMKTSFTVVSAVSSQQISRTQDRDASEVIKRVPGISIIDDKFVIARGLAQRYNNVWINNSAVPSSEADTRSFSFDIIPSGQIENIMIIKSPSPELPADFSGGFIKITTKNMPSDNEINFNYGINFNTKTHFQNFKYSKGSSTDFLGFDNGFRNLKSNVPTRLDNSNSNLVDAVTKEGFNNDWSIKERKPIPDQRFSFVLNRKFDLKSRRKIGLIAAANYSYTSRTLTDLENSRFGVYNKNSDEPEYQYKYSDNQYSTNAKLGALLNVSFIPNDKHKFEFRNIFNQLGRDRYTERSGYQYISAPYIQEKSEYLYSSRTAYSGQLAGNHLLSSIDKLDWTLGFSYANKRQPDRRIIEREENGFVSDEHYGEMRIDQNEIFRDFIQLDEYIYSFTTNYSHDFNWGNFTPSLKVGAYAEYRDRDYKNRIFYYQWDPNSFPTDFAYQNVVNNILTPENYGYNKLHVYEDTDNRDSYSGNNTLLSGYVGVNIPISSISIYPGIRFEHNNMRINNYTSKKEFRTKETDYSQTDFFPSINASYKINENNLIRLAYGASINRQEFREVSSSVYYDFDLFSSIKGNPDLKPAYIQNFDIRYELYPSSSEIISLALFYKHFKNPIEWTYIDAGGSYTYTFENAKTANNFGLELDIRKNLDFIGLDEFSIIFNGSLISSKVKFDEGSLEHDRPMQGQSPYLVNTGIFYKNDKLQLSAGVLYNIIGKRIVGIGRVDASSGGTIDNDVPDMYEMPRNVLDFTFSKKFGEIFEISFSIRDILAQDVVFKQFPQFYDDNGNLQKREQVSKKFNPGQNILISAKFNF